MKFSAEYYEAKEKEEAAKRSTRGQVGTDHPPANGRPRADTNRIPSRPALICDLHFLILISTWSQEYRRRD
jgi:hypothetical protein